MNWYNTFYWLVVADGFKSVFDSASNIFSSATVIIGILMVVAIFARQGEDTGSDKGNNEDADWRGLTTIVNWSKGAFYTFLGLSILTWTLWAMTPTKKDCLLILAGGGAIQYLTQDSVGKQLPKELSGFVVNELKSMAEQAKVEFVSSSYKDKVLDEAKKMTTTELMDKIKTDTSFAHIILDK